MKYWPKYNKDGYNFLKSYGILRILGKTSKNTEKPKNVQRNFTKVETYKVKSKEGLVILIDVKGK